MGEKNERKKFSRIKRKEWRTVTSGEADRNGRRGRERSRGLDMRRT